jgi:hypothetical protein
MNRASLQSVAYTAFWQLMREFAQALETTFPDCAETKDWCLYMRNVVDGHEGQMEAGIAKWADGVGRPLQKAKYAKAVQSLTGSPATVYHAIAYHDMEATEASFETLRPLAMAAKLRSNAMADAETRAVFWQYLEELTKHALAHAKRAPPPVPTTDEIAADIARRKQGAGSASSGGKLQQGLREVWQQLRAARGVGEAATKEDASALHARVSSAVKAPYQDGETTIADGCRARDPAAFAALCAALPDDELGAGAPTEEVWALLERALGLVVVEDAIPAPMMRGIESAAQQLVRDLAAGKADPSKLDLEAIGRQVLSGVDEKDVSTFATKLDQLLPALEKLQPRPR